MEKLKMISEIKTNVLDAAKHNDNWTLDVKLFRKTFTDVYRQVYS